MGRKPKEKKKLRWRKALGLCGSLAPNWSLLDLMSLEPQILLSLTWDDANSVVHLVDRREGRSDGWDDEWGFELRDDTSSFAKQREEPWPDTTPIEFLAGGVGFHGVDESLAASEEAVDLTVGITTDDRSSDLTEGLDPILSPDRPRPTVIDEEVTEGGGSFAVGWPHLNSHLWSDTDATVPLSPMAAGVYGALVFWEGGLLFDVGLHTGESKDEDIEGGTECLVAIEFDGSGIGSPWAMNLDGRTDHGVLVDINLEAFDLHLDREATVRVHDPHAPRVSDEQEAVRSIDDATDVSVEAGCGMRTEMVCFDNTQWEGEPLPFGSATLQIDMAHYQMGEMEITGPIDLFAAATAPGEEGFLPPEDPNRHP